MNDKDFPSRKSPRADWYDYAGGTYFVTAVTKDRISFFGNIENEEIKLSLLGNHLKKEIENLSNHYRYVRIINYVVMPNHFHLIVYIEENELPKSRRHIGNANYTNNHEKASKSQGWLSIVIGGLKANITRFAHKENLPFAWQTRFHDHIIRGTEDFNKISKYIDSNVENWKKDKFYPLITV